MSDACQKRRPPLRSSPLAFRLRSFGTSGTDACSRLGLMAAHPHWKVALRPRPGLHFCHEFWPQELTFRSLRTASANPVPALVKEPAGTPVISWQWLCSPEYFLYLSWTATRRCLTLPHVQRSEFHGFKSWALEWISCVPVPNNVKGSFLCILT